MGHGQGGEGVRAGHGQHLDHGAQAEKEAENGAARRPHHHRAHNDGHLHRGGRNGADGQIPQRGKGQQEDDCHQYRQTCDLVDFRAVVHTVVLLWGSFTPCCRLRRSTAHKIFITTADAAITSCHCFCCPRTGTAAPSA